tara:strand:+ start:11359 stop:12300 length:942 start_codon:yes stop_codon:yes gene_type:complete
MKFECKACGKVFDSERSLHAHIKVHGLRVVSYYQKYYPRYDLHDGSIIKFKSKDQYFSQDFNNRTNQRKWIESQDKSEAQKYLKNLLKERIESRDISFSPCQVELRSLLIPSIVFYEKFFDDYYKLCQEIGLENKYKKAKELIVANGYSEDENLEIFIDTREQMPLDFNFPSKVRTLKYGDYALSDKDVTCNCYIERKSLADFISTISVANHDRFCREIERAKEDNANLIILVEDTLSHALSFPFLPYISKKIKVTPEFIFHKVRRMIQNYNHIQFLFVKDREEASRVTEKIFFSKCVYKDIDLQLAYDKGIL